MAPVYPKLSKKGTYIYVDPGSISSGYAVVKRGKVSEYGLIQADSKEDVYVRIRSIEDQYRELGRRLAPVDGVYVELLPRSRTCHPYTHSSATAIGKELYPFAEEVKQLVPIGGWQKHVDWKGKRGPLKGYASKAKSEDDLAAVGMALWGLAQ